MRGQKRKLMTRTGLFIILTLISTSCSSDNEVVLTFPSADGLTVSSRIVLNGLEIGHVKSIKVGQTYEIVTTVSIDKSVDIPVDSEFILTRDFLGTASIEIKPGKSRDYIIGGQEIKGQVESIIEPDSVPKFNLFDRLFGMQTKQDSILYELKRLNDNLERLTKKTEK
jgi:ABC-type transporter Mla subunit MlaD